MYAVLLFAATPLVVTESPSDHARQVLDQVAALADAVRVRRAAPPARVAPVLAMQALRRGVDAPSAVEEFVRTALGRQVPAQVLTACALALGDQRQPPASRQVTGLRDFEDRLERIHRDVIRALGSGRDPELLASRLQGLLEGLRLAPGSPQPSQAQSSELRELLARGAKVDQLALVRQAMLAVAVAESLADQRLRKQLLAAPTSAGERGVTGQVIADRDTPFGRFVVGGAGPNRYECDQLAVIVDVGGDDEYHGPAGTAGVVRRFGMVVDFAGDDVYRAANDGIGSACLGLGLVIDFAGGDEYHAAARSAGFGALGVGGLFDLAGDDTVTLGRHGGGVGFAGVGVWLDGGSGVDRVEARTPGLAAGIAGGIGILVDDGGNDVRTVTASKAGSEGGLGLGLGLEGFAPGGLGLLLDVAGDDRTTAPDLAVGVAAAGGLGCYVDVDGIDGYRVGRMGAGAATGGGLAVFLETAGDDHFVATAGPSFGAATDGGYAWCEDRSGDDEYELPAGGLGWARSGGLAVAYDGAGVDHYQLGVAVADDAADRRVSLSVFSDAGGAEDVYETSDSVVENGMRLRQTAGSRGQVVLVRDDR